MTQFLVQNCLLAGDIGATKTTLALFALNQGLTEPLAETTVVNNTAASFEEMVERFLQNQDIRPDVACFGAAGPVINNRVKMTNMDWILDGIALQIHFGLRSVVLVNDLVATAMGAVHLPADRLLTINEGQPDPFGAIAVIAPGTGLGEAFLIRHRNRWLPIPSEGGHSSFAPTDEQQRRLLHYMSKQHRHVSTEMVCSGNGIPNLYDFLCAENGTQGRINDHQDHTRIIIETALAAIDDKELKNISLQAMKLFTTILASESANLALKVLGTGGLYIGGGIPPRILPFLQQDAFMHSFARGKYRTMLAAIPIHVVLEPKTALIGAAAYGRQCLAAAGGTT